MFACEEHDKKCLLINKRAACRLPRRVVVCLITFAVEHPLALCTRTMAIQQGRRLVFIGLCPQRGIIRLLLPRGIVAWILRVRDKARQHVTHLLYTGNDHGGKAWIIPPAIATGNTTPLDVQIITYME